MLESYAEKQRVPRIENFRYMLGRGALFYSSQHGLSGLARKAFWRLATNIVWLRDLMLSKLSDVV
jgi:hypothetical protein